jgi:hypothetical protein
MQETSEEIRKLPAWQSRKSGGSLTGAGSGGRPWLGGLQLLLARRLAAATTLDPLHVSQHVLPLTQLVVVLPVHEQKVQY